MEDERYGLEKENSILTFLVTGRHCENEITKNKDKGWKILGSGQHIPPSGQGFGEGNAQKNVQETMSSQNN